MIEDRTQAVGLANAGLGLGSHRMVLMTENIASPGASEGREQFPASDSTLDTVGLFCPVPIIKTAARMRQMGEGEVLEVLSDDRVILVDMPAWCRSKGHEFLGRFENAGEWHLFVRKRGRSGWSRSTNQGPTEEGR